MIQNLIPITNFTANISSLKVYAEGIPSGQPKTIEAYSRGIRRIGGYFDGNLDNLTQNQLLDYFHQLKETASWSTVKLDLYGLKFFYLHVLPRRDHYLCLWYVTKKLGRYGSVTNLGGGWLILHREEHNTYNSNKVHFTFRIVRLFRHNINKGDGRNLNYKVR